MDQSSGQRTRVIGSGAMLTAIALLMLLAGTWRMFAHFPGYDDEGYVLLTLRNFLEHGGLYSRVYSQYGPVFYLLHQGLHGLTGLEIDHAYARWFTLAMWLLASAGCGAVTWRDSRSVASAAFATVASFLFLYQFSEEAFHPGAVIVALLPVAVCGVQALTRKGREVAAAACAGVVAAVLALLKVNVGVLFGAGVLFWAVAGDRDARRAAVAVLGVALAGLMMRSLAGETWVQVFVFVFGCGLGGLALVMPPAGARTGAAAMGFAGTTIVAGIVILGAVSLGGTSPAHLWEGILAGPLRHADSYSYAVDWRPGTLLSGAAGLGTALLCRAWFRAGRVHQAGWLVAGLRVIWLAGAVAVVALLEVQRVIGVLFSYALPWLWLWVARLESGDARPRTELRPLLAAVLGWQMLHAYPVGGIQICWGSFLLFPLVGAALPETGAWLASRVAWRPLHHLVVVLPLAVVVGKLAWTAASYRARYETQQPLGLPGTGGLRLSERETLIYQTLAANSLLHADRLFSLPGMFSFNLWSGVPPPTLRNTTVWYSLLDEAEQDEIIRALAAAERPALIVDAALLQILQGSGAPPTGPLYAHLLTSFSPVFSHQGLGFWLRKGRAVLPIGTAWRRPGDAERLQVFLAGLDAPVERIILRDADSSEPKAVWQEGNCRVVLQLMNLDGTPRGNPTEPSWPFEIRGPASLEIHPSIGKTGAVGPASVLEFATTGGSSARVFLVVD